MMHMECEVCKVLEVLSKKKMVISEPHPCAPSLSASTPCLSRLETVLRVWRVHMGSGQTGEGQACCM